MLTDTQPGNQKYIQLHDVFTFKGQEYLVLKNNSVNRVVYCLDNGKSYRLRKTAKVSDVRLATPAEIKTAVSVQTQNKIEAGSHNVGDVVRIKPEHATARYNSSDKYTIIKVNPKTVKLSRQTTTGVPFILNAGHNMVYKTF